MKADSLNNMIRMMPMEVVKEQGMAFVESKELDLIHTIGVINIYKLPSLKCISVNTQSYFIRYFDLEDEAVDFYLDHIDKSSNYVQMNMF